MSGYVEIVDAGETFPFTPAPNTTFQLRVVPDDVEKKIRAKATKRDWDKGQRVMDFDTHQFAAQILDFSIVGWEGVKKVRLVNGERTSEDLACTPANKLLLPEALKAEITRLCLGKEAAAAIAEDEKKD